MGDKIKKHLLRILNLLSWAVILSAGLTLLYAGCRIFVCDQFVIPTDSMSPTLIPGDRILVNKLIFGARIYKKYDFSEGQPLESWRMPGIRRIRPNEVIVFNVPEGFQHGRLGFKINYVYSKRCIGTPGDSVCIRGGYYTNNNYRGIMGVRSEQELLASKNVSELPKEVRNVLPFDGRWNIKEFGPVHVPAKGDRLSMDAYSYGLYRKIIEYETGKKPVLKEDCVMLGDSCISEYQFSNNYYFTGGDRVIDSADSRYWGFVPEEFIIGVAKRISYSRDRSTGRMRRDRVWRRINKGLDKQNSI